MSTTIYLYLKTHKKSGLKYFGKTIRDPFRYKGSGKRWLNHLKVHGNDVNTEILFESSDIDECTKFAINYSLKNNIVNNPLYANLIEETLTGGDTSHTINFQKSRSVMSHKAKKRATSEKMSIVASFNKGVPKSEKHKVNISKSLIGREVPDSVGKKISESKKGRPNGKKGVRERRITCEHCGKEANGGNYRRWHGKNCKMFS